MVAAGETFEIARYCCETISENADAADCGPAFSPQDSRECAVCRGGAGARNEKRRAFTGALGRGISELVSNCAARNSFDADFLRYGAHCGTFCEAYAARYGRSLSAGGAA